MTRRSSRSNRRPALSLGVNVAEAGALLAVLEQACGGEQQHGVNARHAEDGGEDVVDKDIGETRDGRRAASHQRRSGGRGAGGVGHEGGRGAVEEAAAGEL